MSRLGILPQPTPKIVRLVAALAVLAVLGCSDSSVDPADAENFFQRYAAAVSTFDPQLASLYADDARILVVTRALGGGYRRQEFDGVEYARVIPDLISLARVDGSRVSFEHVTYVEERGRIRITGTRSASNEREGAPFSLVVGPDASGEWKIFQERLVIMPRPS